MKVLLVTNDFPPRIGGIQTYLWNLYERLARAGVEVTVIARQDKDATAFDAEANMRIIRHPTVIWPTPALGRLVAREARDADVVAIGATLPMASSVVRVDRPVVVHTHGFEIGWSKLPAARQMLSSIMSRAALVTYLTEWTGNALESIIGDTPKRRVRTGVDLDVFHTGVTGEKMRTQFNLGDRPTISFVSRLVRRKGADTLIAAMPAILEAVPDAALLIVGGGPDAKRVQALARTSGAREAIHVAGRVAYRDLPDAYASGDVFAMPCRTRWGGFEVEGLGLVYLEAQACGRPAVTGDSGGAPEAIDPGRTGITVQGGDVPGTAAALIPLLLDRDRTAAMGSAAREFVAEHYDWNRISTEYLHALGSIR